jgi:excisionase family DNA binding protein
MLTSTKLGKEIGLTKKTVNRLAKEGRIPSIVLPSGHRRFNVEEVKAALSTDLASVLIDPAEVTQKDAGNGEGQ